MEFATIFFLMLGLSLLLFSGKYLVESSGVIWRQHLAARGIGRSLFQMQVRYHQKAGVRPPDRARWQQVQPDPAHKQPGRTIRRVIRPCRRGPCLRWHFRRRGVRPRQDSLSTWPYSRSTGVERPKIDTLTLRRAWASSTSSTAPSNPWNGPSLTRTSSPIS
jgi:hypothetical protein